MADESEYVTVPRDAVGLVLDVYEMAMGEYADQVVARAARLLAAACGLDPDTFTPEDERHHFPHQFMQPSINLNEFRGRTPDYGKTTPSGVTARVSRPETDEEVLAWIGVIEPICGVYGCGQLESAEIHQKS